VDLNAIARIVVNLVAFNEIIMALRGIDPMALLGIIDFAAQDLVIGAKEIDGTATLGID
jgi:hypothetical protein